MNIKPPAQVQSVMGAVTANRQTIGPGVAATSVVAALAGLVLGLFSIGDCVRFQTKAGQCDAVVRDHGGQMAFAALTLAGAWGGYNTLNTHLRGASSKKRNSRGQFTASDD